MGFFDNLNSFTSGIGNLSNTISSGISNVGDSLNNVNIPTVKTESAIAPTSILLLIGGIIAAIFISKKI